ncbi:hypothetical protein [Streptomyces hygroscopicus]|uniref:hypothetical protein n=1 Tax=Streptomyces hygroscopicus TaxID=1912 RepID=UPI00224029D9|nr:hypothetical protein [Streptomyces hygroscopicus]
MSGVSSWWGGLHVTVKGAYIAAAAAIIAAIIGLWSGAFGGESHGVGSAGSTASPLGGASAAATPTASTAICGEGSGDEVTIEPRQLSVASTGTLTANVACRLQPGWHLLWIVQLDDVGTPDPHPNYYQRDDLGQPGKYTYEVNLSKAAHGSVRRMYVVLMDGSAYDQMSKNLNRDGSRPSLPNGTRQVSNTVLVGRY